MMHRPLVCLSFAAVLLGGTALVATAQQQPPEVPGAQQPPRAAPAAPRVAPGAAETPNTRVRPGTPPGGTAQPADARVRPGAPPSGTAQPADTRVRPGTPPRGTAEAPDTRVRPGTPPGSTAQQPVDTRGRPGTPPRGVSEAPETKEQPGTPPRGTAQAPPRRPGTPPAGTAETPQIQERPGTPPRGTAQTPPRQRPGAPPAGTAETPQTQQPGMPPRGTAETPAARQRPGAPPAGTAETPEARPGRPGVAGSVELTPQQRTVFRDRIIERRTGPTLSVDIDVSPGRRLPRSVAVQPLPADIVRTVPAYRGYSYVRRGDEIVIIEPRTREVVEVIDSSGEPRMRQGAPGGRMQPGPTVGRFQLTPQQRTTVRERIVERRRPPVSPGFALSVGATVPRDFAVEPLPPEIVSVVPAYRGYMYFQTADGVVIVEPDSYEIVDVIPITGGGAAVGTVAGDCMLTDAQKAFIVPQMRDLADEGVALELDVGSVLPQSVSPHPFPEAIVREMPALRSCRYVMIGNEIAVVEPRRRSVVTTIEVQR